MSFGPSFTHEHWRLGIEAPSITRARACIRSTSTPVAPGPNRSPSWSTERPTSEASRVTAAAEQRKGRMSPAPA